MHLIRRVALALGFAVAGCGGYTTSGNGGNNGGGGNYPPDPGGNPAPTAEISVLDNSFNPNAVVIAVGGTVTWRWVGTNGHSVTPSGSTSFAPTADVSYPPKTLTVTFPQAGTYEYYCIIHGSSAYGGSGMVGVIYVR